MRALVLASALLSPTVLHAAPCDGPVCNFDTLAPYFARRDGTHPARGVPPVHILQIGDSHTAGDVTTSAWRDLLQAEAGDGGRGVMPPGHPYSGYIAHGATAAMSPDWTVAAAFGGRVAGPRPALGVTGLTLTSTAPGATMALTTDPGRTFDRFIVCTIARPGAGALTVRMADGTGQRLLLDAAAPTPRCVTIRTTTPQTGVTLTATGAPVTIASWAIFRDDGGVALSNLGVVGAQLGHFGHSDDALLREELRVYAPDLVVLAFGTNEGFVPRFDAAAYEATLRGQIDRLRALAPGIPLLLLGPPDALSRDPALRTNGDGATFGCADASIAPPLFVPPALNRVRAIQRKVAGDLGVAWWDWQRRMGGPCSAARWAAATPPLMRADHIHLRTAGGAIVARRLQDDLDHAAAER